MLGSRTLRALAALGLAAGTCGLAALSWPAGAAGFSVYGESLPLDQRDFRVRANFLDATANDNHVAQPMFPGQTGAALAIWKAHAEWSSGPWAGTGAGDGLAGGNPVLGSGNANFDNSFQGVIETAGGPNSNVHAALDNTNGNTLAFTTLPISDGWTIFYFENWTWDDGPAAPGAGLDLQGVATHEIGHALGLNHSTVPGATMQPAISGNGSTERSIEADDIAGVQAIYGVKAAGKPRISALAGSAAAGQVLQLLGQGFAPSGNEAWFTNASATGTPVQVPGLVSVSGGTRIDVLVPAQAANGEVLVRVPGSSGAALSNAFPIDVVPFPVSASQLAPTAGPQGGFTLVEISGSGLLGVSSVRFDGTPALEVEVVSDALVRATTPPGAALGAVDVQLVHSEGVLVMASAFTYLPNPPPQLSSVSPVQGGKQGGTTVTLSGATLLGVTQVRFDGVPGTQLQILDATQLSAVTPPGAVGPASVEVVSPGGSSLLAAGFAYLDLGDVIVLGPGLAGWMGAPELTGAGDLTPGSSAGLTLELSKAFPLSATHLFLGLGAGALPIKGGIFYPVPTLIDLLLFSDGQGKLQLAGAVPLGTPSGVEVVLQAWVADAFAPQGWSASNGLLLHVP